MQFYGILQACDSGLFTDQFVLWSAVQKLHLPYYYIVSWHQNVNLFADI